VAARGVGAGGIDAQAESTTAAMTRAAKGMAHPGASLIADARAIAPAQVMRESPGEQRSGRRLPTPPILPRALPMQLPRVNFEGRSMQHHDPAPDKVHL
jgi:hypothetical protein